MEVEFVCSHCGKQLNVYRGLDSFGDLIIKVNPCNTCFDAAEKRGREEVRKKMEVQHD